MSVFPETGYTPANLRRLIGLPGITQAQAAAELGVSERSVCMWLAETDKSGHLKSLSFPSTDNFGQP